MGDKYYAYVYPKNLTEFSQPKVMTQVLSNKASFTVDAEGLYYFVGGGNAGGYGIKTKDGTDLSLCYVCGLLNSSLLDWNLKKLSTRFRGGFFSYAKRFIGQLPIKPPAKDEKKLVEQIEKITNDLLCLSNQKRLVQEKWLKSSLELANNRFSLMRLLLEDEQKSKEDKE
jgi:hypothetical protein